MTTWSAQRLAALRKLSSSHAVVLHRDEADGRRRHAVSVDGPFGHPASTATAKQSLLRVRWARLLCPPVAPSVGGIVGTQWTNLRMRLLSAGGEFPTRRYSVYGWMTGTTWVPPSAAKRHHLVRLFNERG